MNIQKTALGFIKTDVIRHPLVGRIACVYGRYWLGTQAQESGTGVSEQTSPNREG